MSHKYNNPVISALDDIASELEKTGNADLASLVDEVAAEVLVPRKPVTAKAKPTSKVATKPAARAAAPAPKRAETNVGAKRARIASAMRKIARAQVSELEDIAQELIKEGDKRAALEVLKIAEDLDSEYEYSGTGKHKAPTSKGDASKVFDKAKANKPDAKMSAEEKEKLETPFGASDAGYPLSANKKKSKDASFDRQLEALIRLASEEDPELDAALPAEDEMDAPAEDAADEDMADEADDEFGDLDSDDEDSDEGEGDEDADDADLEGLEGLDMGDEGGDELSEDPMDLGGDGEDELAAMMDAMGEDEDVDASSDRMYDADAAEDEEEPAFGDEEPAEEDPMADPAEEDEPLDEEASAMGALQGGAAGASLGALGGPAGAAIGGLAGGAMGALTASVDKKKILALAQKLAARGEKGLAARVARLAKK